MFKEEQVEQAIIEQLQGLGYEYLYGPEIERDYKEVILKDIFLNSIFKINPDKVVSSSIAIFFNSFFNSTGILIVVLLVSDMIIKYKLN